MERQAEYKVINGFESPNYTQAPNDFFDMIPDMGEAELRVTLVMIRNTFGWHKNEFKMGISKLAAAAGLSRQGALDGANAAENRGTFRRSNPDAITEAEWELVTLQPVEGTPPASRGDPLHPVEDRSGLKKDKETKESEVEETPKIEKDVDFSKLVKDFEKFHGSISVVEMNLLGELLDDWRKHQLKVPELHPDTETYGPDVVMAAVRITAKNAENRRSMNYTGKIIKSWIENGYGWEPKNGKYPSGEKHPVQETNRDVVKRMVQNAR